MGKIKYIRYESEKDLPEICGLIDNELSEPYSVYTYRYFLHNWPRLAFVAIDEDTNKIIGVIISKIDKHFPKTKAPPSLQPPGRHYAINRDGKTWNRGYIAMLTVSQKYRKLGIGSSLIKKSINAMIECDADEVVMETEVTNKGALALYERLGFIIDKRLHRYYLNGSDAYRLKLWITESSDFNTTITTSIVDG